MPAIIIGIISMKMIEKGLRVMRYMTTPISSGTTIATIGIGIGLPRSGRSGTWNSWPVKSGATRGERENATVPASPESTPLPGRLTTPSPSKVHLELRVTDAHDVAAA